MLDVDHLRAINTAHGHVGGDAAIHTVATVLTQHLRDEDLAARFGARSSPWPSRTPTCGGS